MNGTSNEKTAKYLRQISLAVAFLLIFYGVAYFLSYLFDLINFSTNYLIWMFFQTALAIILMFIGIRVYTLSKVSKLRPLFHDHKSRVQIIAIATGFLAILPFTLFPLPPSSWLHSAFFNPLHQPISFSYRLGYYSHQGGTRIWISTVTKFNHGGVIILYDIKSILYAKLEGWLIIPYEIYDPPSGHPQIISPAYAFIQLGEIENGDYFLKIVMSDAADTFYVHKRPLTFSIEAGQVTKGELIQIYTIDNP